MNAGPMGCTTDIMISMPCCYKDQVHEGISRTGPPTNSADQYSTEMYHRDVALIHGYHVFLFYK